MASDASIWSGVYGSFAEAAAHKRIFEGARWLAKVEERVRDAMQSYSNDGLIPKRAISKDYILPAIVTAMLPGCQAPLRVVDFGGGMGATFYELQAIIPNVGSALDFHIVENAQVCARAKEILPMRWRPHFHSELHMVPSPVDIAHCGSALHYVEDWRGLLEKIVALTPKWIVFAELPAGEISKTFVTLQEFYGEAIPVWFWRIDEFIDELKSHGYRLAYRSLFLTSYRGHFGPPPMDALPSDRRLTFCQLAFCPSKTE